jgi:hypothetical protein
VIAWWLVVSAALAGGWRLDGQGVHPDVGPASVAAPPARRWSQPLTGWSNATPVLAGGLVCTPVEPTTLRCYDAATGALRWERTSDYVDTLTADAMANHYQRLAELASDEAAFEAARREISETRRALRSGQAPPDAAARMEATTARMEQLRSRIDAMRPFLTPPDQEVIGYSSPTPWTDGRTVWALFGNGVLSAFQVSDGKRLWSRWLGPSSRDMRGYHLGMSASPQLADGVLLVPYAALRGVDPATGADRWVGPAWSDYGTPTLLRVGGVAWAALPTGQVLRVRDGRVGAEGLGDVMYKGPHAEGDRVWYVGGRSEALNRSAGGQLASAWRLTPNGDRLTATKLWEVRLPTVEPFYAQPIAWQGQLYAADRNADLWTLSADTGAVLSTITVFRGAGDVYAPLQIVSGRLVVAGENGNLAFLRPGPTPAVEATWNEGATRAAPLFIPGGLYLRTLSALTRYGG